ncbi:MAG: acetate--CoA ligase [Gammaproteobacteria bacterium]|nr:acetate--CoA ligase [Gammaproteobacteria bacterium]
MASKNIVSVLQEERVFPPPAQFSARARLKPADLEALRRHAQTDYTGFWAQLAREHLVWHKPFTVSLDEQDAPNFRWFTDGELNVSFNCLDVHLADRGHKPAIIFEGEPGDVRRISYQELHGEVCRFANTLKSLGVQRGDRVAIYMPLVPEIIVAMHACNRIGAIHSVVFGGFSAPALKERIEDTGAKVLITADGGWRAGHAIELKVAADKALAAGCPSVKHVVVLKRTGRAVSMEPGRDLWWHEAIAGQSPACEPEWVDAEHPLYLLYTSGSTGKPKGIQHSSAGYLLGAKLTTEWVFDLREEDVFWCTADAGWVTGHSYLAYGPLAAGATVVMYEGGPTYPDGGRFWKICQDHGVSVFYTAPTAIRALMKLGDEVPARYDLSRLRLLGSVGEPINPEAWMWYHRVIGGGRCPIVDTWWQTETGAIMLSPLPGITPAKPGSCTLPLPGIEAQIVDDHGEPVTGADAGGYLVIKKPWPSMLRTIWRNNDRYLAAYWEKFRNRYYVAGDSAHRDKDGYFWIMGRIDDVLNVAGHRLGTMEIESALVAHPRVAEAAVVGKPHDVKGESVFAYVVCRGARPKGDAAHLTQVLRDWVGQQLGAIAKPDEIRFADNLPKTRSGKIMRRLLRAIARGEDIAQDVSTLENPAILEQLRGEDEAAAPATRVKQAAARARTAPRRGKPAAAKRAKRATSKSRTGKSAPRRAVAKTPARRPKTKIVKARRAPAKTAKTAKTAKRVRIRPGKVPKKKAAKSGRIAVRRPAQAPKRKSARRAPARRTARTGRGRR